MRSMGELDMVYASADDDFFPHPPCSVHQVKTSLDLQMKCFRLKNFLSGSILPSNENNVISWLLARRMTSYTLKKTPHSEQ
jgi:hypothetical protein